MRLGLLTRFATLSFPCVAALAVAMGFGLSFLLTRAVSEREWENTAALTTKEVGKGTGLGVATVYGIVKQSDGNI